MNYSLVAGGFVTLSLFFLFLETRVYDGNGHIGRAFVFIYGFGVVCWLLLGVLMDQVALVLISMLQLLFLSLYFSERKNEE